MERIEIGSQQARMRRRYCGLAFLIALQANAVASEDTVQASQQVVVNGSQSDVETNRDFVAGKLIIGKRALMESGAQTAADALRREPSITVGKDGRLSLLGLPGYTQILVDGLPPSGIDPYALDVAQIERVEIIKTSTAATGPFGIAGTINIVRRKIERKAMTMLSAGAGRTVGHAGGNVTFSSNQLPDDLPITYNYILSASSKRTPSASHLTQTRGATYDDEFKGGRSSVSRFSTAIANANIEWKIDPGNKLVFSPEYGKVIESSEFSEQRSWLDDRQFNLTGRRKNQFTNYGLPLEWKWQIADDSYLNVKVQTGRNSLKIISTDDEFSSSSGSHLHEHGEVRKSSRRLLNLDYASTFAANHEFTAGAKYSHIHEVSKFSDSLDGSVDMTRAVLGNQSIAEKRSLGFFLQDEWRLNKTLAINMGLSIDTESYDLTEGRSNRRPRFTMAAPSLHVAKKIGGDRKRQVRASIARSFKAPSSEQLMQRPYINSWAPCYVSTQCPPNSLDRPDSAGNPHLLPERALGINLSYTHGIDVNSDLTVELYSRDISNKVGSELFLEDVVWSNVSRYVQRPTNLGDAKVRGVNLEGRLSMREITKDAPNLDWAGSIGVASSELSNIPGPDNRLDGQLPWRAKLSMNYTPDASAVKYGMDAHWLPGDWIRNSLTTRIYRSRKFTINANANWKVNSKVRISLNFDNLTAEHGSSIEEFLGRDTTVQRITTGESYRRLAFRLNMAL